MTVNMYTCTQKMPGKKAMIVISNEKSTRTNGYLARTEALLKLAETGSKTDP